MITKMSSDAKKANIKGAWWAINEQNGLYIYDAYARRSEDGIIFTNYVEETGNYEGGVPKPYDHYQMTAEIINGIGVDIQNETPPTALLINPQVAAILWAEGTIDRGHFTNPSVHEIHEFANLVSISEFEIAGVALLLKIHQADEMPIHPTEQQHMSWITSRNGEFLW